MGKATRAAGRASRAKQQYPDFPGNFEPIKPSDGHDILCHGTVETYNPLPLSEVHLSDEDLFCGKAEGRHIVTVLKSLMKSCQMHRWDVDGFAWTCFEDSASKQRTFALTFSDSEVSLQLLKLHKNAKDYTYTIWAEVPKYLQD